MKTKIFFLLIISYITLSAGIINYNINHTFDNLHFSSYRDFDILRITNGGNNTTVGAPNVPSITLYLSIPTNSEVIDVRIENQLWQHIGSFNILPTQKPVTVNNSSIEFTEKDNSIYSDNNFYPTEPVVSFLTGNKSGFSIACITYSPIRYNPVSKELQLLTNGNITIEYIEKINENISLSTTQAHVFSQDIIKLVSNPEFVLNNMPFVKDVYYPTTEYIIITPANLASSFEPLIRWKITKGVGARVITTTWINNNYNGYDLLEKIRNFAKDYHQNYGLLYLVLAGDYDNLGARMVPISCGGYNDTTPSDLYFSDIVPYSSDWDANNNNIYGEYIVDSCDWFSDIYVGRFPVNTISEAINYVNKVLIYEKNPPSGFIEKSLMAGAGLWFDSTYPYSYFGSNSCDSIADNFLPQNWTHIKMYQTDTISYPSGFADSMSNGFGWCYIAAHGAWDKICWYSYQNWPQIIGNSLMDNLSNGNRIGVIHSMACHSGWFDNKDCVGEHIFNASNGGAIAVIFNGRFGWGWPPNIGSNEYMDIRIAEKVFKDSISNIGRGFALGKDQLIIWPWGFSAYEHWSLTEYNLFGDPETQIYSREPTSLSVLHKDTAYLQEGIFEVIVNSSKGPVKNAVCCLCRPYDSLVWFKATTDANGRANIHYKLNTPGNVVLTVYARDFIYYQDTVFFDNTNNSNVLTYWTEPFDSTNSFSIGTNPAYFGMAHRFTPVELATFNGYYIKNIIFYLTGGSNSYNDASINLYGMGTPIVPGSLLATFPFTVTGDSTWYNISLSSKNEIPINPTEDLWVEVGFTHGNNENPFFASYGTSHLPLQSDLFSNGSAWNHMGQFGHNITWAIKVIVENFTGVEEEIFILNPNEIYLYAHNSIFKNSTTINYTIPTSGRVCLKIYDITGREVRTLVNSEENSGIKSIVFDRLDNNNNLLSSGIYFCRLSTDGRLSTNNETREIKLLIY